MLILCLVSPVKLFCAAVVMVRGNTRPQCSYVRNTGVRSLCANRICLRHCNSVVCVSQCTVRRRQRENTHAQAILKAQVKPGLESGQRSYGTAASSSSSCASIVCFQTLFELRSIRRCDLEYASVDAEHTSHIHGTIHKVFPIPDA
jgi:hypothetical protein